MLSDLSMNYPYLMLNTKIWKIKYVNLFTQFIQPGGNSIDAFPRKYGSFHYLSFLAGKKWNISLFEAIIWQAEDSTSHRGFDVNYLNPVIFYNPIEFSLGSPDNSLMGLNLSFKASHQLSFYGQFVIDEWRMKEMKAGNGWHGNKYATQLGFRSFNTGGVKNLELQGEYNYVRPYMYSHWKPMQNYAHYKEPLAYPFGANTQELVGIVKYNYNRFYLNLKYNIAAFGLDTAGLNFGKNIFSPYTSYVSVYGNHAGQGLRTLMQQVDCSVSYLLNPSTNMNLFLAATIRKEENHKFKNDYLLISFGFRTSLRNLYYDFY
jgi:hypothetical protein